SQAAGTGVALVGGVAHPSADAVVGVNGLSFKAHYNGNATYLASDGACEPLSPAKLTPVVTTDVHNAAHGIIATAAIGSTVHDKATVSGGLTTPTGTVTFTLYPNATDCTGASTGAGTVALSGGVAHPSSDAIVG